MPRCLAFVTPPAAPGKCPKPLDYFVLTSILGMAMPGLCFPWCIISRMEYYWAWYNTCYLGAIVPAWLLVL